MKRKILLAFCLLTSIAAASVAPVSVTPSSGTGLTRQFVISYTSTIGQSDFNGLAVSFSPSAPSLQRGPCQVWVGSTTGQIQLYLDSGYPVTGQQGGSGTLTNGHCTINLPTSTQWYSGGAQASFTVDVTFASNFGPINIYGRSLDSHMVDSDWILLGAWTASAPAESFSVWSFNTYTNGVYGSPTGTGSSVVFQHQGYDSLGAATIGSQGIYLSGSTGACLLTFTRATHLLTLYADNWALLTAVAGTPGAILQNSQCTVDVANTTYGDYAPWSLSIFTVPIDFKPSFAGSAALYASTNALSGGSTGWVSVGNWTIPTMPDKIIGYVKESTPTLNPGELNMSKITLSQAGQDLNTMALRVYHGNDPVTFRIRYAKPNSQVWVTRIATVPAGAPSAGTPYVQTVCGPDNGHESQGLQKATLDPVNGDNYGACYLGMTDATGYLEWTGNIWYSTAPQTYGAYLSGMISAQFYIGPQTFNPNFPGITDGPMNENNYVGALVYWVIGTDGYQGPVPY